MKSNNCFIQFDSIQTHQHYQDLQHVFDVVTWEYHAYRPKSYSRFAPKGAPAMYIQHDDIKVQIKTPNTELFESMMQTKVFDEVKITRFFQEEPFLSILFKKVSLNRMELIERENQNETFPDTLFFLGYQYIEVESFMNPYGETPLGHDIAICNLETGKVGQHNDLPLPQKPQTDPTQETDLLKRFEGYEKAGILARSKVTSNIPSRQIPLKKENKENKEKSPLKTRLILQTSEKEPIEDNNYSLYSKDGKKRISSCFLKSKKGNEFLEITEFEQEEDCFLYLHQQEEYPIVTFEDQVFFEVEIKEGNTLTGIYKDLRYPDWQIRWEEDYDHKVNSKEGLSKEKNIQRHGNPKHIEVGDLYYIALEPINVGSTNRVYRDPNLEKGDFTGLMYIPQEHAFYAVTQEDDILFEEECNYLEKPLQSFYQASSKEETKNAREALNKNLTPLHIKMNTDPITEVIGYKGKKYTYVRSEKIKNHLRSYKLDTDIQNARRFSNDEGKFDVNKLKESLKQDFKKPQLQLKQDLIDPYAATWSDWAEELNPTLEAKGFEDNKFFNASAEAKLMRYTHGASLMGNLSLNNKSLFIRGEAASQFSLAEGKAELGVYFPSKQGYRFEITKPKSSEEKKQEAIQTHKSKYYYNVKPPQNKDASIEICTLRLYVSGILSGFAGAKAQIALNLHIGMEQGKMMLKGLSESEAKQLKKQGESQLIDGGGDAFVGISGGCELKGGMEWENPEHGTGENAFRLLAEAGGKIEGNVGAGANANLFIVYDEGKFKIRAKVGATLGLGLAGQITCTLDAGQIWELFQFIYHQLKNVGFHYLDIIDVRAFRAYDRLSTLFLLTGENIETWFGERYEDLINKSKEWMGIETEETIEKIKKGSNSDNMDISEEVAENYLTTLDQWNKRRLQFAPPEAKASLLEFMLHKRPKTLELDTTQQTKVTKIIENTLCSIQCKKELFALYESLGQPMRATYQEGESIFYEWLTPKQQEWVHQKVWEELPQEADKGPVIVQSWNGFPDEEIV